MLRATLSQRRLLRTLGHSRGLASGAFSIDPVSAIAGVFVGGFLCAAALSAQLTKLKLRLLHERNVCETETNKAVAALAALELERQEKEALLRAKTRMDQSIRHRGLFGEQQLERVLEASGVSFQLQCVLPGGGRPDAVVSLPNGLSLLIDAKTPAFEWTDGVTPSSMGAATDPVVSFDEEAQKMKAFAAKIKLHITGLQKRNYQAQLPSSLPNVYLYLPGDGFWSLAASYNNGELQTFASERNITLLGPTMLGCLLADYSQEWRARRLEDNAGSNGVLELVHSVDAAAVMKDAKNLGVTLKKAIGAYNALGKGLEVYHSMLAQLTQLSNAASPSSSNDTSTASNTKKKVIKLTVLKEDDVHEIN